MNTREKSQLKAALTEALAPCVPTNIGGIGGIEHVYVKGEKSILVFVPDGEAQSGTTTFEISVKELR